MIISNITFHNFGLFYGTQKIDFATSKKKKNITLILAKNGGGKSTFMRGINYLFWGKYVDTDEEELPIESAISLKAANEIPKNTNFPVWISIKFDLSGKSFTLKRGFDALYQGNDFFSSNHYLHLYDHQDNEDVLKSVKSNNEAWIKRNIPEELYKFYFIREEGLSKNLGNNNGSLADALADVFKTAELDALERLIRLTKNKVDKDISKFSAGDEEWNILNNKKSALELEIKELEKGKLKSNGSHDENDKNCLIYLNTRLEEIRNELDKVRKDLESLGSKIDPRLPQKMSALAEEIEGLEKDFKDYSVGFPKQLAVSGWTSLLKDDFKDTFNYIDHEYKNDNLPRTEIGEAIINKILESDDEKCICNRILDDTAIKALKKLLKDIEDQDKKNSENFVHEEELFKLMDKINPAKANSPDNYFNKEEEFKRKMPTFIKKMDDLRQEIKREQENYHQMEIQFKNQDDTLYNEFKEKQKKLEAEKDELNIAYGKQKEKLGNLKYDLIKISKKLGQMPKPKGVNKIIKQSEQLHRLMEYADQFREKLRNEIHKILNVKTRKFYWDLYHKGNTPHIHPDSLLPEIFIEGVKLQMAKGGAESQCLALAYMMALNSGRNKLYEILESLDIKSLFVGEHGTVLDSVLAPVEPEFRCNIIKGIPENTPQATLLFANQQWEDGKTFGKYLKPFIGKIYYFDCLTSDEKYKDQKPHMKCFGKKLQTMKYKKNDHSFTTIKELKSW